MQVRPELFSIPHHRQLNTHGFTIERRNTTIKVTALANHKEGQTIRRTNPNTVSTCS